MTRHAIICLREEARRLIAAMSECALDETVEAAERGKLVQQMASDAEDVHQALLELGGPDAIKTVLGA